MCGDRRLRAATGFTLIELVVFVLVLGVGVMGTMAAINQAVLRAGEPIVRKQALALAEAVLDEAIQRPFTNNVATPAVDPTVDPSNSASRTQPHEVDDYDGMDMSVVRTIDGIVIPALAAYRVRVTVAATAFGVAPAPVVPALQSKMITVRVTGPAGTDVTLQGFRVNGLG